jgi:hypothetical protein
MADDPCPSLSRISCLRSAASSREREREKERERERERDKERGGGEREKDSERERISSVAPSQPTVQQNRSNRQF